MKLSGRVAALAFVAALGAASVLLTSVSEVSAQPQAPSGCRIQEVRGLRGGRITLYSLEFNQVGIVAPGDLRAVHQAQVCDDNLSYVRIETPQGARMVRRFQVDLGSNITPPPCPCQVAQATDARNASSSGLGTPMCNHAIQCVWGK